MKKFNWPVRVYYEDTDAAGIVYYATFLRFLERGRTEFLRDLGYQQQEIAAMKLAIGQPLPPSTPAPTQGGDHHSHMEH